jgi:hypothetical protein
MNRWRKIAFNLAKYLLVIYALTAVAVIVLSPYENNSSLSLAFYILAFILIPLCGAYGAWQQRRKALFISFLFFLSQSIRVIGGGYWFPYPSPISLGVPFGDFSNGQGYLIDFFAIAIAIHLASLLRILTIKK